MSDYWLCEAGVKLRQQINDTWPVRDRASDGWIGDASHQAVASDHNPCWTCTGDRNGVVRAIDVDSDLSVGDKDAPDRLANQLIKAARAGKDNGRLSYVIWDHKIASGTYSSAFWTWRTYTGSDPHTNHIHVSFKPKGDFSGGSFPLPIFTQEERRRARKRLRRAIRNIAARIRELRVRREQKRKRLKGL